MDSPNRQSGSRRRRPRGNRSRGARPDNHQLSQKTRNHPSEGLRGPSPEQKSQDNLPARNRSFRQRSGANRNRNRSSRVLTINQVLVKYDNLLEQHLTTRRKYYEYFNRVDERQLHKLEKNFFDSIEHLRRFETNLEPWQREALEKRKTERYKPDLTYSNNRGWDPEEMAKAEFRPDENEDPHFKESQKEAFQLYKDDTEESEGSYEDYLRLKGIE